MPIALKKNLMSIGLQTLVLTVACFIDSALAQSWVTGSPPNDSVATTYFPYLATQLTTGTKYGTHSSSEVGDIWVPNYNGKAPPANANSRPAVIVVHGGGGTSGSRASNREIQMSQFCAAHGYVAFNIDYTLGAVWPKDVYDWRLAIRYLRANAATYGIDPNHIGVIGGSFGGFCAGNLSGITNGQHTIYADSNAAYNNISLDGYSGEALNAYSGDVQVACDLYGPMDQITSGNAGGIYSSPTTATLKNSSAVQYVHPTSAPLLISHGTSDTTVSISQSEEMTNYLGKASVPFQFKTWAGVGHTFLIYQSGVDLRKQWMDWFDKYLLVSSVAPYIQVQPANQSGCLNNSATFSVTANGTTPLAYQWYGPTGAIAGATSATYSDSSLAAGDAGSYSVVITNAFGAVTSSVVTLTVNNLTPPAITTDVADVVVLAGNPTTLAITATGDNLQYQWYGPAGLIANATNASYVITNAAVTDAGTYQVLVYNPCATLPSRLVTLTVNGPPAITANPSSATNCTGDAITFVVSATGTAPLAYQWFGPGGSLSGANANSLTVTNLSTANSGNYYCTVTNAYGSVSSDNATLLVSSNADVTFTQQPTDVTVNPGDSASFTVAVAGGGNYSYLWLKNDYDTITNAVATNATLTLTNLSAADSGTYFHCLVNNDCSIFSSANAYVYVNGASVAVTTNFTTAGTNIWICPGGVSSVVVECWGGGGGGGGSTSSSIKAGGGGGAGGTYVRVTNAVTPGLSYTNYVGDGGASGGTSTSTADGKSGTNSWFAGSGVITLVANGGAFGFGGTNSASRSNAPPGLGTITGSSGPSGYFSAKGGDGGTGSAAHYGGGGGGAGGVNGAGGNASSTTNTSGSAAGPVGGAGGNGSIVSGSSGSAGATPGGGGGAGLGASGAGGKGTAGQVTLTYNLLSGGSSPIIVGQPQGVTNASGNSVSLQITASGSPSPTFQWRKAGSTISGQTAAAYNITSSLASDSGSYDVVVANSSGSVTSSVAVVLITNAIPSIISSPQNQTVSAGATATFSVTATGSIPLSYQWFRGSSPIGGATSSTYSLSGTAIGDSGSSFTVVVTNAYGSITSSPAATLTVNAVASVGSVVISQVYSGGSKTGATYIDDYVVLKNISASTVNISGWSLQHDKLGVWQIPYAFTNGNPVLPPGGYYLIQCYRDGSATIGTALPAADEVAPQTSTWNMSYASADAVALVNSTVNVSNFLSGSAGAVSSASAAAAGIVDLVGSSTSIGNNYLGSGVTPTASATLAAIRKNSGCQNTPDNSLDFATAAPNPLNSSSTPAPCATPATQFYQASDNGYGGDVGLENLIYDATSGTGPYYIWSSTDSSLSVSNWTLEGTMAEFPIANTPNSHYGITVTPGALITYYICAHTNAGPYAAQEPLLIMTTSDFFFFNGSGTNQPISAAGVFQFIAPNSPPSISQQPVGVTNAAGNALTLSVTASGSSPLAYQWYNGVNPIGAATSATYGVNPATTNDSGNYTLVVTNAYGAVTSAVAVVLITNLPPTPPFIIIQPQAETITAGNSASFTVAAGGSQPLAYQWQRNGAPIGGATVASYNLTGATTSDSGSTFAVVVTNAYGAVTSAVVTLTVNAAAPELLSLEAVKAHYYLQTNTATVDQPTGTYSWAAEVQGVLPAKITATTVAFTGTNAPNSFTQSSIDETGLAQDEILFGSKAALDAAFNNGNFHYVTTFASGNKYTNDLPLGAGGDAYPNAPALTAPAADWSNGVVTLHAVTGGYQIGWVPLAAPQDQINIAINDAVGRAITEIDGLPGNLTNYVLPGSILDPGTSYQIELTFTHFNYLQTNAAGVILYGLFEANNDFTVYTDPAGVAGAVVATNFATVRNGVNATNDIDELTAGYLMAKYSTNGAAAKFYVQFDLTGVIADTNGPATLRLYRSSGAAAQHVQLWALNQPFSAPTNFNNINWNQAPANDTSGNSLLSSGPATATLVADLQAYNITNQTFKEIVIPAPWGKYVFGNKITLVMATAEAFGVGNTNASGGFRTVITNSLLLPTLRYAAPQIVSGPPPVIAQQPTNQSVLVGQNASFVVVATGGGLGYQWRFANAPLANAVAASLVLTNVAAPNVGNYAVVITNAYGAVTSSVAGLTVTLPPVLGIASATPGSGVVGLSGVTIPGLTYVVQGTASLAPANWINLLTNTAALNGSFSFQTNAAANGNQYFRILFP